MMSLLWGEGTGFEEMIARLLIGGVVRPSTHFRISECPSAKENHRRDCDNYPANPDKNGSVRLVRVARHIHTKPPLVMPSSRASRNTQVRSG
jgi:hypothetical protein